MKKWVLGFWLFAQSALGATLLPNGQQQFIDANGKPYANGKVFFYSNFPTCTVLKNTYANEQGTVLNSNPVLLDSAGRASIFGSGAYCQVLKDANNNIVWSKYTSDTSSASNLGWGGLSGGTANAQTVTVTSFANVNGQTFYFVPGSTNTAAMTVSINGESPLSVVKDTAMGTQVLAGGEVVAGTVVGMTYTSSTGQLHLITNNTQVAYSGEVRTFAMNACPGGWLPTDGASLNVTSYANLYAAIGTTFGSGTGTFKVPDLRGYFIRGFGVNGNGTASGAFGALVADSINQHSHGITDPGHTHTVPMYNTGQGTSGGGATLYPGSSGYSTGSSTTGITTNLTGTNIGTETRPKNMALLYCIKS